MDVRSMRGLRRWTCPLCGLRVLGDDAALTVHHEEPQCEGFAAKLSELGLRPVKVGRALFVDDD